MANFLHLLNELEEGIDLAKVNLNFLNIAAMEQVPPLSPQPGLPEPAQDLLEIAMAQAELVPIQSAPALVQLATVAGAPAPELAVQALVHLAPGPAQAAPPPLAAFAPATPALAAPAMVAGAPAPELAAAVQAAIIQKLFKISRYCQHSRTLNQSGA